VSQFKELQMFDLYQKHGVPMPEIPLDTLEQKITFLTDMLSKLTSLRDHDGRFSPQSIQIMTGDSSRLPNEHSVTQRSEFSVDGEIAATIKASKQDALIKTSSS
jgi:hypothetical protein